MKKIFTICAAASLLFAACKNQSDLDAKKDVVLVDTTGMYKSNASTDVSTPKVQEEVAPVKVIRETRVVYVDRPAKTKRRIRQASPVVNEPVAQVPQARNNVPSTNQTGTTQTSTGTTNAPGNETSTGTVPAKTEKDKGWSEATKGAVIGGVGGAVTGAIISKNKGKGAILGGVLGAAGGYIIGRKKDKRADATQ